MSNRNNTRELQRQIAKKLSKSELWLVLRIDNEGLHLHAPNEDHLCLFGGFFEHNHDLLEAVNEYVKNKD